MQPSSYVFSWSSETYLCTIFSYPPILRPPDIPADANIMYELELLDVQPPLDYEALTEEELLKQVWVFHTQ